VPILLAALWAMWIACWLRRVELRHEHDALATRLGLSWTPEGLGASVRAIGAVGGHRVDVRFRRLFGPLRAVVRIDGVRRTFAELDALAP
jgi:hypothetical protein